MKDMWQHLAGCKKPIVMYGTGDGADKIIAELGRYGVEVDDFFASDLFVRDRSFHGKKVLSYTDVIKKHGEDTVILLGFGSSLPEVMERFFDLSARHELYAPDVPVAGGAVFNSAYFEENADKINKVRNMLCDEESKEVFDSVISYRLTGKIEHLLKGLSTPEKAMRELLSLQCYKTTLDLGAYNGDTALQLLSLAPNIETVIALEPDLKNYTKLCANTENTGKVEAHLGAAWSKDDILHFRKGGGRGIRGGEGKTVEVKALAPDSLLCGRAPDFIKFDVEGAEREAIIGCTQAISRYTPELQVALYHKSGDIFELPLQIADINPDYKFYMRRYPYVPAWDLNLFATRR